MSTIGQIIAIHICGHRGKELIMHDILPEEHQSICSQFSLKTRMRRSNGCGFDSISTCTLGFVLKVVFISYYVGSHERS